MHRRPSQSEEVRSYAGNDDDFVDRGLSLVAGPRLLLGSSCGRCERAIAIDRSGERAGAHDRHGLLVLRPSRLAASAPPPVTVRDESCV